VSPPGGTTRFQLHDTRRLTIVTMIGVVTVDDWADTVTWQIGNNLWSWASLYDLSAAEAFPCLEGETLRDMKRFVQELTRVCGMRGPVALVVPSRLVERYRVQFDAFSDAAPYVFEVFDDLEMAQVWLAGATDRRFTM
jgi:hypothetical protein